MEILAIVSWVKRYGFMFSVWCIKISVDNFVMANKMFAILLLYKIMSLIALCNRDKNRSPRKKYSKSDFWEFRSRNSQYILNRLERNSHFYTIMSIIDINVINRMVILNRKQTSMSCWKIWNKNSNVNKIQTSSHKLNNQS